MPTSSFICGAFPPNKENDVELLLDQPSMAKPFKKRHFCRYRSSTKNKNPYSSRGLDTFEALLLDLQEKRRKIYTKNNDPGGRISLVRFTYSSSNDLVPIIVKNKDKNMKSDQLATSPPNREEEEEIITKDDDDQVHYYYWRRPCYYMPAVLMVLLVLLVFFGRSVAILCTSIGWYIVPVLGSGSVEEKSVRSRSPEKKKVLRRIWSDSRVTQLSPEKRPKKLGHLRSLS